MKKYVSILAAVLLATSVSSTVVYAKDDSGNIDLYEAFSDKKDMMKTEVGSRIYKWCMHLPDDAIIFKSDRANSFQMQTTSYNANVELEINKNKDKLSLEDLLYSMQNKSSEDYSFGREENELSISIAKDNFNEKYIKIIKSVQNSNFFSVVQEEEELGEYVEERIYIKNNYIYDLSVSMDGEFYKKHNDMFEKLISSYKLSYDAKNKYIKELSESVSTTREFKNKNYGWKITMSPYWKVDGTPNARCQNFSPVYSDEELNQNKKSQDENEFKVPEGITVNLVGSANEGDTAEKWAKEEIQSLKDNYNKDVYDILENKARMQGNMKVYDVKVRYKLVTKKPYIVHNVYVIGNGYKYLLSSTMMEEKYKNDKKRSSFYNMLNSFRLQRTYKSKYLGEMVIGKSLINLNSEKDIKMKKYNFKTKVTKSFNTPNYEYDMGNIYFDESRYLEYGYSGRVSNDESKVLFENSSNIQVSMFAGLNTDKIDDIVKSKAQVLLENDEVNMGLAKVKIKSSEYNNAKLYYIEKEYNLDAINKFVKEDSTKEYDLRHLRNEYTRIIRIGKDIYTETVEIPVSNMTDKNKVKCNNIWNDTRINDVNYSTKNVQWKEHKLQEFDKDKK